MFETTDDGLPVGSESSDHERTRAANVHAHHVSPVEFSDAAYQCAPAENFYVRAQFSQFIDVPKAMLKDRFGNEARPSAVDSKAMTGA
jgi:hypothetical protein